MVENDYTYLVISLGFCLLIGLTAMGTAEAMTSAGSSSILYCQKKHMLTNAYIAMVMTSTIFMYGFIVAIRMIFVLEKYMGDVAELSQASIKILQSSSLFGVCAFFSGKVMAQACKYGFPALNRTPGFSMNFMIMLTGVEVILIFGLIFSIIMLG